jgi:hypothetical protein
MSIKDKVKEQINKTGTITGADLANFAMAEPQPAPAETKEPAAVDNDNSAEATKVLQDDPIFNNLAEESAGSAQLEDLTDAVNKDQFDSLDLTSVQLTEDEKSAFLDAMLEDRRFELPFNLFNGKVTGIFRSRTSEEGRAVLTELRRQWLSGDVATDNEYTYLVKYTALRLQVKVLNGVEYSEIEKPYLAQAATDGSVVAPTWVNEAVAMFGDKPEGMIHALALALREFECKYWLMVTNAQDQDFWHPEDSTLA